MIGFANFSLSGAAVATITFPVGSIVMWHGLLINIPANWELCDGSGGTPDLREKFIRGAAAGQNPGATGGSATHNHTAHAAQTHADFTAAQHAALAHSGASVASHTVSGRLSYSAGATAFANNWVNTVTSQGADHAARSHTPTQPAEHAEESHSSETLEPAYYTVAFIRRES